MKKQIQLVCKVCGKSFSRALTDYNYQKKRSKNYKGPYCSLVCSGKINAHFVSEHANNRHNKYTIIAFTFKKAKSRAKARNVEFTLTLDEALEIFYKQERKCVYSGVLLDGSYGFQHRKEKWGRMASLDRIDSSKGYTKENIQFVSVIANLAKNRFSHEDMVDFCRNVALFWKEA